MLRNQDKTPASRDLSPFDLFIYLRQSRMFFLCLNPDSANNHCLIFSAVVMSCSSHYKGYQEMAAPGEMRKRPCLS